MRYQESLQSKLKTVKPVGCLPADYEMDHTHAGKAQVEFQLLAASWLLKDITSERQDECTALI